MNTGSFPSFSVVFHDLVEDAEFLELLFVGRHASPWELVVRWLDLISLRLNCGRTMIPFDNSAKVTELLHIFNWNSIHP